MNNFDNNKDGEEILEAGWDELLAVDAAEDNLQLMAVSDVEEDDTDYDLFQLSEDEMTP